MLAIGILILFIGIRYNVGRDYWSYELMFDQYSEVTAAGYIFEPGYMLLFDTVYNFSGEFYWVTLITAFIQIFFLFLAIKDFNYFTFSLFLFLTYTGGYVFIVNGMRQGIAACIFFYSLKYISNKNFLAYTITLIFGSLFHASILIVFPLFFILRHTLPYAWYWISFIIAFILSKLHVLSSIFIWLISLTPYARYLKSDNFLGSVDTNSALLFNFINLIGFILLCNYKKLLTLYPKYLVYFNLYFIFLITRNLFTDVLLFMRLLPFFLFAEIIVIPLAISGLFKGKNKTIVYIMATLISIIVFAKVVSTKEDKISYQMISRF